MTTDELRERLINNGIKNLKEFGYEQVNKDNILTDDVYSQFFRSMLNDSLGTIPSIDGVIKSLLTEVKR
jgi:hypothetical protein